MSRNLCTARGYKLAQKGALNFLFRVQFNAIEMRKSLAEDPRSFQGAHQKMGSDCTELIKKGRDAWKEKNDAPFHHGRLTQSQTPVNPWGGRNRSFDVF